VQILSISISKINLEVGFSKDCRRNTETLSEGVQILTDWVVEYFSPTSKGTTIHDALRDASPVIDTGRMPLILQDHRHSRTIIGYEVSRDGTVNLLMFDPALSVLISYPLPVSL
jgi:Peptidase family C78